ncbi:EF-Tu C-terminal domain-related protein [Ekhidna sp.]
MKSPDFIATLYYLTEDEGGRTSPVSLGYRPGIQFPFDSMQTSGEQEFIGVSRAFPGNKVEARIRIASVDYFAGKLDKGLSFEFKEGDRIVGTGVINSIINDELKSVS